jgi:DNA-binding FadR family transcriptional regulator
MSPGPTFERVYRALKEELTGGKFAPGEHLEPALIGEHLNASITPVRDALHRLVGERIVEAPRNNGFRVPAPSEAELRDLYGWNRDLLDLAVRRRLPGSVGAALHASRPNAMPAGPSTATAADLFRRVARRSGNPEHEAAAENLNDRLAAIRIVERQLFADIEEEIAALRALLDDGDLAALRRGIAAYHRRRQRSTPELLIASRLSPHPL